jgi:hypothetical protein
MVMIHAALMSSGRDPVSLPERFFEVDRKPRKHVGQRALERETDRRGQDCGGGDERGNVEIEDLLEKDQCHNDDHEGGNNVFECRGETAAFPPDHEKVAVEIKAEPEHGEGEHKPGKEVQLQRHSRIVFGGSEMKKNLDGYEQGDEVQSRTDRLEEGGLLCEETDGNTAGSIDDNAEHRSPEQGTGEVFQEFHGSAPDERKNEKPWKS